MSYTDYEGFANLVDFMYKLPKQFRPGQLIASWQMELLGLLTWIVEVPDCPRVITVIDVGTIQVTGVENNYHVVSETK